MKSSRRVRWRDVYATPSRFPRLSHARIFESLASTCSEVSALCRVVTERDESVGAIGPRQDGDSAPMLGSDDKTCRKLLFGW